MPDIPIDNQQGTHLGYQHGAVHVNEDHDHLVIDGVVEDHPHPQSCPMISFDASQQGIEPIETESNQPSFLNVDAQGLESPLELLKSEEPLDEPSVPPLVWFGDDTECDFGLDASDQQVFS